MLLKKWDDMPENMKKDGVLLYYNAMKKRRASLLLKRCFDIIVSALMLLFLMPILFLIGIIIKIDSKGSIFYRQIRVTKYGKKFKIFKFRTMVVDADKIGTLVTVGMDPRITRIGSKLRKYRLDELPQLINVFWGDMSFVGTRPEVVKYVNTYTDEMMATLLLPAGVTSLTSIKFKDENEMLAGAENVDEKYINEILPEKMKINLDYVMNYSFRSDVSILFKTLVAVFK